VVRHSGGANRIVEKFEYDDAGRKRKIQELDIASEHSIAVQAWGVEGTDTCYSAPGATKLMTLYNEHDQPIEVVFYDRSDQPVNRVVFRYDGRGKLWEELQTRTPGAYRDLFADAPADQVDMLRAMFQSVGEPVRIEHRYDHLGCRVETYRHFGLLSTELIRRSFNQHGDELAETSEHHSQNYEIDDEGQLSPVPATESVSYSEARFQYEYDEHGNWITKTVKTRSAVDGEFSISSIEKRTISYFQHV
jgi:hypothetical protein